MPMQRHSLSLGKWNYCGQDKTEKKNKNQNKTFKGKKKNAKACTFNCNLIHYFDFPLLTHMQG